MDKTWRMGEVSAVSVNVDFAAAKGVALSAIRFQLQVSACSRFLHPASYCNVLETDEEPGYTLYLRYKELAAMHKQLVWLFKMLHLPLFPPKKWLVLNAEAVLQQRTIQLNEYFTQLLKIGEVRRSQVLMQTLAPPTTLKLKLIGRQGSGKSKFIQTFLEHYPVTSDLPNRASVTLATGMAVGQRDNATPVDVVVDGQTVRITSIEYITVRDGDGIPWLLHDVKDISITLIAKPAFESDITPQRFAECRFGGCGKTDIDVEKQGKDAYDTVVGLLREYLKLA